MSKNSYQKEDELEESGWLGSYEKDFDEDPEEDDESDNYEPEDADW